MPGAPNLAPREDEGIPCGEAPSSQSTGRSITGAGFTANKEPSLQDLNTHQDKLSKINCDIAERRKGEVNVRGVGYVNTVLQLVNFHRLLTSTALPLALMTASATDFMQKLSSFQLCRALWTAPPARIARPGTAEMACRADRLRQSPIRRQTPRTRLTLSAAPAGRAARGLQVSTMAPAELAAPPARPRRRRRATSSGAGSATALAKGGCRRRRGPQQRPRRRWRNWRSRECGRERFGRQSGHGFGDCRSAAPAELQATALRAPAARPRLAPRARPRAR